LTSNDGRNLAEGNSKQFATGSIRENGFFREIGRFSARRGRSYRLTVMIQVGSRTLDSLRPHLKVEIFPSYRSNTLLKSLLVLLASISIIILGVILIVRRRSGRQPV
jgi:hypothetical protein